jgi:non-homologous end joining protein Ku
VKNDLEKIKLKTTKSIDNKEFVDSKELDNIIIEKSYYIAPDTKRGNDRAYSLLVKNSERHKEDSHRKIILKDKENIVNIYVLRLMAWLCTGTSGMSYRNCQMCILAGPIST